MHPPRSTLRRCLRASLLAAATLALALFAASFAHIAWSGTPTPGPIVTVVLVAGELQAWNGGSRYQHGLSFNKGGLRAPKLWPDGSRPFETYGPGTRMTWRVSLPLWMPVVLLGAPALWWTLASRRHAKGLCPACGYNATGLPRCPECGHTPQGQGPPATTSTSDA